MLRNGYGSYKSVCAPSRIAHRLVYEVLVAPIKAGMHIDHLCRNRACVNPWHMEQVTPSENIRRGSCSHRSYLPLVACRRGHKMTPENTYTCNNGRHRICKTCRLATKRRFRARAKDRAAHA